MEALLPTTFVIGSSRCVSRKPGLGTSLIQALETPSTAYGLAQDRAAYAQTGEQTYDPGTDAAIGLTPLPACGEGLGERR